MITWHPDQRECVTFWRPREPFGGLSNMAGGYAIQLGPYCIRTAEHLYQALRYPDHPELQSAIISVPSPLAAKRKAYESIGLTRSDWEQVKIDIMMWCLELKFWHNPFTYGPLLLSTGRQTDIVEASPVDDFWGAKPMPNQTFVGWNMLGRLHWRLRRKLEVNILPDARSTVIDIPNFRFAGEDALTLAVEALTIDTLASVEALTIDTLAKQDEPQVHTLAKRDTELVQ